MVEQPGRWYFPPLAALITAGGRLLLAMLEHCVTDAGGVALFCDTDSLCIVAADRAGEIVCDEKGARVPVLGRDVVERIVARFTQLNPYDRRIVSSSILK